jgi:hypothetical protein
VAELVRIASWSADRQHIPSLSLVLMLTGRRAGLGFRRARLHHHGNRLLVNRLSHHTSNQIPRAPATAIATSTIISVDVLTETPIGQLVFASSRP